MTAFVVVAFIVLAAGAFALAERLAQFEQRAQANLWKVQDDLIAEIRAVGRQLRDEAEVLNRRVELVQGAIHRQEPKQ